MAASFMSPSYTAVFTPIPCAGTEPRPAVAFTVTDAVRVAACAGKVGTATEAIAITPSPSRDEKNRARLCIAASDSFLVDGAAHGRFRRLNRSTSQSRGACRTGPTADVAMKLSSNADPGMRRAAGSHGAGTRSHASVRDIGFGWPRHLGT